MININKILVIDDFLSLEDQTLVDNLMRSYKEWQLIDGLSPFLIEGKQAQEWYCTKILFQDKLTPWDPAKGITKILHEACTKTSIFRAIPDADVTMCLRIRLNGTFKSAPLYPHEDGPTGYPNTWTIVYYINDSDGGTCFYHDEGYTLAHTVPYKKGRAVIFPAEFYHNAESPVDHNVRITAGLMYVINSQLNDNLFLN